MLYRLKDNSCPQCLLLLPFAVVLNLIHHGADNHSYRLLVVVNTLVCAVTILWKQKKLHGRRARLYVAAAFSVAFAAIGHHFKLIDSIWLAAFIGVLAGYTLIRALEKCAATFPRSFTPCEMLMVIQGAMSYLIMAFGCTLARYMSSKREFYCAEHRESIVLQILFLGVAVIGVVSMTMRKKKKSQPAIYLVIAILVLITYCGLFKIVGEPFHWLLWQTTSTKTKVMPPD